MHRDASPARSTIKSKKTQPWVWGPGQELAAVVSFLTSEGTHALPPLSAEGVVDPGELPAVDSFFCQLRADQSLHCPTELVLDFDPYAPTAALALEEVSHLRLRSRGSAKRVSH